jgi:hypothetical protein
MPDSLAKETPLNNVYAGLANDKHGLTQLGRLVLDARLFDLIVPTQDCAGWDLGRMQGLMERVQAEWDKYGQLPSRLPPDLLKRHGELYGAAIQAARAKGWNPELGEDE